MTTDEWTWGGTHGFGSEASPIGTERQARVGVWGERIPESRDDWWRAGGRHWSQVRLLEPGSLGGV